MAEEEIRVDLIGAGGNVRTRHIPGFAGAVMALVRLGRRAMGGLRGQPTSSPRNPGPESALPLNVFHVLEEEYIALHGELPHIPGRGWDVVPDQVLDASTIGRALADAAAGSAQATAFSRHVQGLLDAQWDEARLRNLNVAELVDLLNELLSVRNLYDPRAVATVELRGETQEYVRVYADANCNDLGDEDLRRFNRLLRAHSQLDEARDERNCGEPVDVDRNPDQHRDWNGERPCAEPVRDHFWREPRSHKALHHKGKCEPADEEPGSSGRRGQKNLRTFRLFPKAPYRFSARTVLR